MKLPSDVLNLLILLGIIVGAIQCFFGYRIFKFVLVLTGFIVGGALAGGIAYGNSPEPAVAVLIGLAGGLIGALLMAALYFVGIFLFGAILGGVVGTAVFAAAQSNPEPMVLLILGIIGGVIALIFQKLMIILSTAFGGAWNVVTGIAYFATGAIDPANVERLFRPGASHRFASILCWLVLGSVGVIYQYRSVAMMKREKDSHPTDPPRR